MLDRGKTDEMDWETFKMVFLSQYFPTPLRNKMERDLFGLKQKEDNNGRRSKSRYNDPPS